MERKGGKGMFFCFGFVCRLFSVEEPLEEG